MARRELELKQKELSRKLAMNQAALKDVTQRKEELVLLSREGQSFLGEMAELFHGSEKSYYFLGLQDEQSHLDKKLERSLEDEEDTLQHEKRQIFSQEEGLRAELRKIKTEEDNEH